MRVKRSDVIKIPFTELKTPWQIIWIVYVLVTLIPGTFFWMLTLGAFRYFHLSGLVLDYTINKAIVRDYPNLAPYLKDSSGH